MVSCNILLYILINILGVTKGARHKLLLSIKKLSERQGILEEMERELSNEATYITAAFMMSLLEQLRGIVISPIKPNSPLAALVVRVLDLGMNFQKILSILSFKILII